ncbi:MAG: hypothetical protein VX841_09865 [Pseudomonadota bacterium]|nr:hypothetical protein [Pseudomonadota bacterium]
MTSAINQAIFRLPKRAEASARSKLIQTFVDIGPLFSLLSGVDHQVLYGRRGTGKTHVLNYLADNREQAGDAVVVTDLRNIGSSAGLYADASVPLPERATRLLVDTLLSIHSSLYEYFVELSEELDLSRSGPALDRLADAITEVKVVGTVETVESESHAREQKSGTRFSVNTSFNPSVTIESEGQSLASNTTQGTISRSGREQLYVNFGATGSAFKELVSCMKGRHLWVLLDEWSSIPLDLQPYLADLLRRSLFSLQGITVKIAAIEHRSELMISRGNGDYIGIEAGADAAADVNLDDFMVFDNDSERSQDFFQELLAQHILSAATDIGIDQELPKVPAKLIGEAFTEKRAIEEFVRACEGVPRDAINIISLAAQRAIDNKISVNHVRAAANSWYQRDKEKAVSSNATAGELLHWIIDIVIGERKARAFLLRADESSDLIDSLYDSRVLHILKRSVSSHDQPGVRYDVYKLDYGCYVNLLSTTKAPQGLLPFDGETLEQYVDVPPDDYRSIRRAILNLIEFEGSNKPL